MSLDRRAFLKLAAAATCVFGLRQLLAQDSVTGAAWYRQALARMKERNLHGIVVVAPAADPDQLEFGTRLWNLLECGHPEAHELFLNSVFIVMTPAVAASSGIRKADEKADRFLLDPGGRRMAADECPAGAFDTAAEFTVSFAPFLYGKADARLKERADELKASAPEELLSALRDLESDEIEVRERATESLVPPAAGYLPLYAWTRRRSTDVEVQARLRKVVERHYRTLESDKPGPRLPYGTRVPRFTDGGCGQRREIIENEKAPDLMDACGMGRIDGTKTRMFLRFLSK